MIEKFYAAHIKNRLDASAINVRQAKPAPRRQLSEVFCFCRLVDPSGPRSARGLATGRQGLQHPVELPAIERPPRGSRTQGRRGGGAMSPAATRGYDVGFKSWMTYEPLVLASSEHEAIAKGKAIYGLAGLGDFSFSDCGEGLARLGS
jgi:hypothetical protein